MNANVLRAVWFLPVLAIALASSVTAQSVRMGGGLRPGFARPPLHLNLNPHDATSNYGPYSPAQVRHAYGVDQLGATGNGQIIGIVDAYGDSAIQTDLNNFCSYYSIPSTSVQILYPQGKPRSGNSGWALETALDVEWAHAIAPNATIILSVAKSASLSDLLGAVDAAANAGATVISMSWGAQESSGINTYDSHFQAPGVTYVASSGDSGELAAPFEVEWPASSPYVVGVGGTTLYLDANGNRSSETAWSGSGGGLSSVYGQPVYQKDWQSLGTRCVPDVAFLADPNTGVGVAYGRYLYEVGGTSVGAPQWAALIALASSVRTSGTVGGSADIYSVAGTAPTINSANFFDITSGSDGSDPDDLAGPGYDLVTGLGSPVAVGLVNALAPQTPDFSVSVTPSSQTVTPGSQVSYTVTVAALNKFTGEVDFTVSGLPSGASASFSPASVSGSGSSTLTFTTSATGTYTIKITGTSGTLTHTATVTLIVATPPDFSISASPSSQTVQHGNSTSYTVKVIPSGGFSATVALSASGLPSGASASFSPSSVRGGSGSSTMTVKTGNKTPSGTYPLTITGNSTSPALTHSTTVSLAVK